MRYVFLFLLSVAVAACARTDDGTVSGRVRLAQTEAAATAAFNEVTALAQAGIIKKGSPLATRIADAELVLAAAIRVWRTNPEDPDFIKMGVAALPPMLKLLAEARSKKAFHEPVIMRNLKWAVLQPSLNTCLLLSTSSAQASACTTRFRAAMMMA